MDKTDAIVIIASQTKWVDGESEWEAWKESCRSNENCNIEDDEYLVVNCTDLKVIVFNKESIKIDENILGTITKRINDIEIEEIYIHQKHRAFQRIATKLSNNITKGVYTSTEEKKDKEKLEAIKNLINLLKSNHEEFCEEVKKLKDVFSSSEKKTELASILKKIYLFLIALEIDLRGIKCCEGENKKQFVTKAKDSIDSRVKDVRKDLDNYIKTEKAEKFKSIAQEAKEDIEGLMNVIKNSNGENFVKDIENYFDAKEDENKKSIGKYRNYLSEKIKNLFKEQKNDR